jgi:hypothetical protein
LLLLGRLRALAISFQLSKRFLEPFVCHFGLFHYPKTLRRPVTVRQRSVLHDSLAQTGRGREGGTSRVVKIIALTSVHFVSQARHLLDKLPCVSGRAGVVLLVSAQCVMVCEYLL